MHPRDFSYDGYFLPHIAAHRMNQNLRVNQNLSTLWDYILEHHIDMCPYGKLV